MTGIINQTGSRSGVIGSTTSALSSYAPLATPTFTGTVTVSNNLEVTGDIKNSGLEYLCARWPLANDSVDIHEANLEATDTSNILKNKNVLLWSHAPYTSSPERADFTITGLTTGVWYMHATFGFDRTASADSETTTLILEENSTLIWEGKQNFSANQNVSQSFTLIRDYSSSVPTPVVIKFECDKTGSFRKLGNCITIFRIG